MLVLQTASAFIVSIGINVKGMDMIVAGIMLVGIGIVVVSISAMEKVLVLP